MANILQDSACSELELLSCGALLPESVAQLVVLEDYPVSVEALRIRGLLPDAPCKCPRAFRLDAAHDLQFRTTAGSSFTKDDQHLAAPFASTLIATLVHEEHEDA